MKEKSVGQWFATAGEILLAVVMLVYLGKHSLNFFGWTFTGEDVILYSVLGLFTTSIGALIWLAIFLFKAESSLEKFVALSMVAVCLLGEFATAGFDMYLNINKLYSAVVFTAGEIKMMTFVVAGLALLNGMALIVLVAGQRIIDAFQSEGKQVVIPAPALFTGAENFTDRPGGRE